MSDKKLEKNLEKYAQLGAEIQMQKAALKTTERKKEKSREILVGRYALRQARRSEESMTALCAELNSFLTRDTERALFGLAPLPKVEKAVKTKAAVAELA